MVILVAYFLFKVYNKVPVTLVVFLTYFNLFLNCTVLNTTG
jgi:hypothetical protein